MSFAFLPDELRLLLALFVNGIVLASAWRFTRRFEIDRIQRACDALLLYYLVQYLAVCVPGLVGALTPLTMLLLAVAISAAMWAAGRNGSTPPPRVDPFLAAAFFFVVGYVAALIFHQRFLPPPNDAISYHLPAAVQWLKSGRLGIYETWFYNPANSYSPLAGSAFLAWLIAPMGNDVLARFVEAGPLVFLFVAALNLCRRVGVNARVAALVAAALVLARPFISQTILAKDDLFVAAFFLALLGGCARDEFKLTLAPWRIGIALGLLLATKYTVLFSVPIALIFLDAPIRAGWRWKQWLIAIVIPLLLAGPWYARNWLLTANPLYPADVSIAGVTVFHGMFHVRRSDLLATPAGAWAVFARDYYSLPPALAVLLLVGWAGSLVVAGRELLRDPLKRAVVIGPALGIALFLLASPYGEMRFIYPSLALLFVAAAIATTALPILAQIILWGAVALLAALTAFRIDMAGRFVLIGIAASAITLLIVTAMRKSALPRRYGALVSAAVGLALFILAYVYWHAYVGAVEESSVVAWSDPGVYGPLADGWGFIRKQPAATVAYANTFLTYPLMGFDYRHGIVYAPTRHDLDDFIHMPRIDEMMAGESITRHIGQTLREHPDRDQWLRRLKASNADYLFVAKQDPAAPWTILTPPELEFAARDPGKFQRVFENEAAVVFKIVK